MNKLLCPCCGGDYLHHGATTVLNRDREDSEGTVTTVTTVDGKNLISMIRSAAIPGRRDAVHIAFTCEFCPGTPILRIIQHKGGTFLEWVPPEGFSEFTTGSSIKFED